ncbi:hypothetical protein BVRB_8g196630 [Beta vulgaris subsp. vulgaris]|nr:hypothetical protein BVRB_8g196630 [Beta vulgaris subsp. vulgaris]
MSVDESTHNKVLVTATITVQKPNLLESLRTNIADKLHDAYADCWEEAVFALELVNAHEDQPSMFKSVYVPRDERFSGLKQEEFGFSTLKARLHSVVPALWTKFLDVDHDFPYMTAVNLLFNEGESNNPEMVHHGTVQDSLPHVIRQVSDETDHILRFELPQSFQRDGFSWFKDEEFARQTLAGMNPLSIKCLKKEDWPLKSKLDPNIYGPPESALKVELVENEIKGSITFDEALKQNKLFIIDYHDAFLPYVNKVSEMEDRNLYGSRTLFIYDGETLKPIAIELTRPPYFDGKIQHKQWKEVFVPRTSATRGWLWKLAKAHVLAHDSSYHQLISHCIYGSDWRFDREALPEDLKSRGMAVEDSNARHGWKLTIDDYPYAKDGLDLWFILKKWVEDYVHHYYGWDKENKLLENDKELHAWWEDIKTVGHGDKKNETWWPTLETLEGLIDILTTIIWVTSGHHAAVNFGQYAYAGYFPNRPTITRTKMPTEGRVPPAKADEHKGKDKDKDKDTDKEKEKEQEQWEAFLKNPEKTLLRCFPSQRQAATVMLVLDVLSSHSSEEEYLGQYIRPSWEVVPEIKEAFMRFKDGLHKLEEKINDRNKDEDLKHRCGAGILPYELLKPSSVQGVTGMGVPNSISI